DDSEAVDMFKESIFSYNILSDPDKHHQYDTAGFEAIEAESQELELDLSSLGTVNTMFAILFSKLGVAIKTTVSATVLEEALNEEKDKLRDVEARILTKRVELSKFETKYREVLAQFTEMVSRYTQEMQPIDELLKQRNTVHASYSTAPPLKRSSSSSKSSDSFKESKKEEECQTSRKKHWAKDRPKKSKWFKVRLKMDKDKPC
ncbi:hypothetical protein IFM89_034543, partial [Coptis chinensis]